MVGTAVLSGPTTKPRAIDNLRLDQGKGHHQRFQSSP